MWWRYLPISVVGFWLVFFFWPLSTNCTHSGYYWAEGMSFLMDFWQPIELSGTSFHRDILLYVFSTMPPSAFMLLNWVTSFVFCFFVRSVKTVLFMSYCFRRFFAFCECSVCQAPPWLPLCQLLGWHWTCTLLIPGAPSVPPWDVGFGWARTF